MVAGATSANTCAVEITSACESTPGAVYPTLTEPSLLSPHPRMVARMVSPSATASS